MAICFFDAPSGRNFPRKNRLKYCLRQTAALFGKTISSLSYQFVGDGEMLELNRRYLDHDTYTDILTFDQSEPGGPLEGDVFVSRDRVEENGKALGSGVEDEYCRVVAHGLLHLCGLDDHAPEDILRMRQEEQRFIELYHGK